MGIFVHKYTEGEKKTEEEVFQEGSCIITR